MQELGYELSRPIPCIQLFTAKRNEAGSRTHSIWRIKMTRNVLFALLLITTFCWSTFGQSTLVVVNAARPDRGLAPCTQASAYSGEIDGLNETVSNDPTRTLVGGYRVKIRGFAQEYWAGISYVGNKFNKQLNFLMPCDAALINTGPIVELHKQLPSGNFVIAAITQISLEQSALALFTQSGNAPAGTFFVRRLGVDAHLPLIVVLNGMVVPAALNLTTEQGSGYALILYTNGGAYGQNRNTLKIRLGGIDGLGTIDYYGRSSFADSVQQVNVILNVPEIIKRGLALNQFTKLELVDQNGTVIGSAEVRFTNNP